MAAPVGNKLGDKNAGAGVVVRLVIGDTDNGNRFVPGFARLAFGQAGAPGVQRIGQFDHAGSQAAAVGCILTGQVAGKAAARQIGG